MKLRLAAILLATALAACSSEPPPPDMKDPASVARAFVTAYNAKDLARMMPLVDQQNLGALQDALAGGEDSEAWQGIFAPEMVDLLAREAGRVEGPRYEGRDAVFKVGSSEQGDIFTVELSQDDNDHWLIVENAVLSVHEFEQLPAEPKKRR